MAVQILIQGLSEAVGTLPQLPKNIERLTLLRMSQIVFDESYRGASRHSKKGDLLASLYNRAIPNGREVGHDPQRAPHAIFVNAGTRPHVILPKNKKALRWVSGNGFVFAGKLNHPGYIGDAYMLNALTIALQQFRQIVDDATRDSA